MAQKNDDEANQNSDSVTKDLSRPKIDLHQEMKHPPTSEEHVAAFCPMQT